jgi:hypothetical protein
MTTATTTIPRIERKKCLHCGNTWGRSSWPDDHDYCSGKCVGLAIKAGTHNLSAYYNR